MRRATAASTGVALVLVLVKTVAWLLTGSISVLSSLIDSLMDVIASLVNVFAVRHSLQPADAEHRFGHGKAEPLAGLAQAAFLSGSAVLLMIEAVGRLFTPQPVVAIEIGIGVMVFSIVVTVLLVTYQRSVVRRTRSTAVSADALHYETDILINGSVIVSLTLTKWLGWEYADPLFGMAIALYLVRGAVKIARRALDLLMDREFTDAERDRIREIVLGHPKAEGMHDLRTRSSGMLPFVQLHLELDGDLALSEAHEIADEVEERIRDAFPGAEVIIHQDPAGLVEIPRGGLSAPPG
jgi:ferrous-iron efflux pump FieF